MLSRLFQDDQVNMDIILERSTGMRWGGQKEGTITLTAAEPDFIPSEEITNAMIEYIKGGYFPYAPQGGIKGFRESISDKLKTRKNVNVDPAHIVPVDSAHAALNAVAASILQPGDEAIIFDPVDLLFGISVRNAKGVVVEFPAIYENGKWDLSALESYITPKTRLIGLCNPQNPMGVLYTKEELKYIAELADKYNLWIMNDEIWSDIIYSEKPFVSINSLGPELNKRTISLYGFSKGFAVAGLRAGFIYTMNQEAFDKVVNIAHNYGVDVVTQVAMKAAFDKAFPWVDAFVAHLQGNRDYLYERLLKMPYFEPTKQEATFVSFPNISKTGMGSQEFVDWCLKEARVLLVPGTAKWFGTRGEGHVRICYSTSRKILTQALDRIEEAVNKL